MAKYLVIVESPTKAKTISSILGKDYTVESSMGHVVDLPSNKVAVDIENNFQPKYHIIPGKEKTIKLLKKQAKDKETIYLATDPDREGEAISWHIKDQLNKKNTKFKRVVFHEITEDALKEAFKNPSKLDTNKVNAQIARRVLDRIVGYSLSPVLWKKIVRGLSAGRVQSIALKFIAEREKEILEFKPETTYSIEVVFKKGSETFKAKLSKFKGKKAIFKSKEDAQKAIEELKKEKFSVKNISKKKTTKKPPPPYITSLMQQEAFNRLRFSAQKTMIVAQQLYEGRKVGEKSIGLITYMRTDSFHVSPKAKKEAKEFILNTFGQDYLSSKEHRYKRKKGAQLAHEAIRPTSINQTPQDIQKHLSDDESRLYNMIWRRFLATFMSDAVFENTKVSITSKSGEFSAEGRITLLKGYLEILEKDIGENPLPEIGKNQEVDLENIESLAHTTKPPFRYNDASLVKLLEDKGIGRPSTYAPTIYTLIRRNYTKREKRAFVPTELGIKVSDLLVEFFPKIMDDGFTAAMEEKLDYVEKGKIQWHKILKDFYPQFKENVEQTLNKVKKEIEYSDKICPKCQGRLVIKWSRRGKFLSCENFPKCKYAESISSGVKCPGCKEGMLVQRRNRRGQNFYGCNRFPKCTYTASKLPDDDDNSQNEED